VLENVRPLSHGAAVKNQLELSGIIILHIEVCQNETGGVVMKMHPVKSSKIDVICYDEQTHKLRVSFREEKPRDFCHVPENTFTAFLNARSKNRFFKRNIEDSFPC